MGTVAIDELPGQSVPSTLNVSGIAVDDAFHIGRSNPVSYIAPPQEEPNPVEKLAKGFTRTVAETPQLLGQGLYFLGSNMNPGASKEDQAVGNTFGDRIARAGLVMTERNQKYISENFPEQQDIWERVGGAVPMAGPLAIGALLGFPAAAAAITVAAGASQVGFSSFQALKDKGASTGKADALAGLVGAGAGTAMAFGIGNFLKATGGVIPQIIKGVINGFTAGASQSIATGSLQLATGVTKYNGAESLADAMTDAAYTGATFAILGGPLGLHQALVQKNAVHQGYKEMGLDDKQARDATTVTMARGMHEGLKHVENTLEPTKDELGRIKFQSLEGRSGIPAQEDFAPVDKEAVPDADVVELSKNFKYVKLEPLNIQAKVSAGATAEEIRRKFLGGRDVQRLRNSYLHDDLKKMVPDEIQQQAMFRSDRPVEFFKLALENPQEAAVKLLGEVHDLSGRKVPDITRDEIEETAVKIKNLRPVIERILNPTPEMQKAMAEGKKYYDEQGAISKAMGTINEIKENYHSSRLYKAQPLANFVKNLKSVNKKFSAHSLQRHYPDSWLAMADGMEFRTENFADALYDHAQEMIEVNYSRQMQNAMTEKKPVPLAAWVREGAQPPGWQQVGTSRKLMFKRDFKTKDVLLDENGNPLHYFAVFAAPKALAEGLKPLTDPNYLKLVPGYEAMDKAQSFAKTGLLSASFFHHYTFLTQTAASFDGYKTLAELPGALKNDLMSEPGFQEMEKRAVRYGMTTQVTHNIQDVWADMNKGDDAFSRVLQKPFIKDVVGKVNANTDLLFKGIQRYIKTMTFSRNMAKWEGEHPRASQEELDAAAYGYAKSTNDVFGGQNWEMLGWNRTQVAMARFMLLAPDWVVSNISTQARAFTKGTSGSQARWTLASGVIGGLVLNNILNYIRTGHSTLENKKGHEFEFEAAPDIYMNNVRGGPGEAFKLWADVIEQEGGQGFFRYAQGKQSPLISAYTRASSGVSFSGAHIWKGDSTLEKNISGFWNIVAPMMGIPIGLTSLVDYTMREPEKSLLGYSLVGGGVGRFSKTGNSE